MSRYIKVAQKQESQMAFGVKGGEYFNMAHKRLVLTAINKWMSGEERDNKALHEALNDLEDMSGGGTSTMRQAIKDIRFATTFGADEYEELEGYLDHIRPRVMGIINLRSM